MYFMILMAEIAIDSQMKQYGQVVIFIEWHLKIDGFTVGALPVYWLHPV
jgi:hypothetical protein